MAKKAKGGPNKSSAIRDYKTANPTAAPKEIAEALAKDGLVVSAQFVSTVLSNAKKKGGKIGKRGPKPGRKAAAAGGGLEQLLTAKKMVEQLGGIENARSALNVLAQLGLG
ncbi:hypothetical protein [Anatilimnocola floriformis]|uniref:hypothetical protein n=1 Tax=Anatilimnocola floriformis TaxID=2948575 RepID=UPI0020C20C2B|nr:hypothetical protein [Anatilimnocola floriformis]